MTVGTRVMAVGLKWLPYQGDYEVELTEFGNC